MRKFKFYGIPLLLLLLAAFVYGCGGKKLDTVSIRIFCADGKTVDVTAEIADTEETRAFGFMERRKIPAGTGMIFVFGQDQILSFWMKNTPHPLSIAYIDSHGMIRDIFDMTPFSLSPVKSTVSVRYALEVPQGWFVAERISVGDRISLDFLN